jgi:PAS domain S-box-containing protein
LALDMAAASASSSPGTSADQLAAEQARAALALSASDMGEFEWDVSDDIFIVSPRMARITGIPVGARPAEGGEYPLSFAHPDDVSALRATIEESLNSNARYRASYRMIRPTDGRVLWMESSAVILRGPDGPLRKLIGVVRDVSETRAKDDEREALVAELDHRVKNVLASVQSLAAQSARKLSSLDAFMKTFSGRLDAMADAHTLLSRARWRGATIGDIAAAELAGLALGRARWSGPEVLLNPRSTSALALALHELATNAVKFGALSTDAGRVEVVWARNSIGGFDLTWVERGGPAVELPSRQGFGTLLLDRVTGRELGGKATVQYRRDGLRAALTADGSAMATTSPAVIEVTSTDAILARVATDGASGGPLERYDIRGLSVLIVEDSMLLALELEAALADAGATTIGPAASVEEALALINSDIDVALIDADLNGQSAAPVAFALNKAGIPFILATSHDEELAEEAGGPAVRKPYNVHQITAALARATGRESQT